LRVGGIARAAGLVLWLWALVATAADLGMTAPVAAADVVATQDLGSVTVPGVGPVRIVAQRWESTVTLLASGPDGRLLGQAESVIGLGETPIAVQTPEGLKTITVTWPRP
jgi:hypothetical protein